jgi:hypothetical protein
LKRPRKLAVFDFARTEKEDVGVDFRAFRLKADPYLDAIGRGGSAKIKKRVLVAGELGTNLVGECIHAHSRARLAATACIGAGGFCSHLAQDFFEHA